MSRPLQGRSVRPALLLAALAIGCSLAATGSADVTQTLVIRGQTQTLHTYGPRGGSPVIVSSGDGGWIHLGPHIAEVLAAHGFFVVGFDVKSYLAGFTSASGPLRPEDVPGDYRVLLEYAAGGVGTRPVLLASPKAPGCRSWLPPTHGCTPRRRGWWAWGCPRSTSSGGVGATRSST